MKSILITLFVFISFNLIAQEFYYNQEGKKVNSIQEAYLYSKVYNNNIYRFFYKNNDKKYFEGKILHLDENEENNKYSGECMWYYMNEHISKKLRFDESGLLDGEQYYYYENGNIWKEIKFKQGKMVGNFYHEYDEDGNQYNIYEENFSDNKNNWDVYESKNGKCAITNGEFTLNSYTANGNSRYVYFDYNLNKDLIVESKIKLGGTKKITSIGGLLIGFKDWDNFIYFLFDNNANVSLGYYYEGTKIDKLTNSKSLDIKPNEFNTLKLIYKDNKFIFTINGQVQYSSDNFKLFGNKIGYLVLNNNSSLTSKNLLLKTMSSVNAKLPKDTDEKLIGSGTGFLVKANYIATCYHIIEKANELFVQIKEDNNVNVYKAIVVQKDKDNDVALLKIVDEKWKNKSQWFNIAKGINVGDFVFTLGYPLAYHGMGKEIKYSDGKISAKTGYNDAINSFQTTIPVQPGNSGSPIFNDKGELLGIVNAKVEHTENVTYGIKVNNLMNLLDLENISMNDNISLPAKTDQLINLFTPNIEIIKVY